MAYFITERKNALIENLKSVVQAVPDSVAKNKLEEIINQIRNINSIEDHEWFDGLYEELFREIAILKEEIHNLKNENLKLEERVTCLEEKLKSTEIERKSEYHWIIVRSCLNSFIGKLYKTVHDELDFNSTLCYHLDDIDDDFSEYDDSIKKDKARKKWGELKQKFSIDKKFQNKLRKMIRLGNNIAHPNYDTKSVEDSVNILRRNKDMTEGDKMFCLRVAAMSQQI